MPNGGIGQDSGITYVNLIRTKGGTSAKINDQA